MASLMLHRDVLTGFGRLPTKVQKKVSELIRKFQEDSTQRSIHLEKIEQALDDKVRSARLGDDWRAIVIAPERGDTFLLMHVDHHDEAYRWCANKRFEAHGSLGMLQVFDVAEVEEAAERSGDGNRALADDSRSYPLDELTDDDLFHAGVPRPLIPAVRAIRTDAAFEEVAPYLPEEAQQVLFWVAAGRSLDEALRETLGTLNAGAARPESPGDFSKLDQVGNFNLVLIEGEEELRAILAEDIEMWRVFLHPYQRKIVEWNAAGPIKINGAAGTGKTVALMHRAVYLAKRLTDPKDKILVTTFTTNLSVTIEHLIAQLSPEAAKRIEVTNLHQLARTICLRSEWRGRIADDQELGEIWDAMLPPASEAGEFDRQFVKEEYESVVDAMGIDTEEEYLTVVRTGRPKLSRQQRRKLWPNFLDFNRRLQKKGLLTFEGTIHQARMIVENARGENAGLPKYRHVLVDELQDFGLEGLRLIAALSPQGETANNPLFMVGDGHQRINRRIPIPLSRAGINVVGRSRRLKINYRTSAQIRAWAQSLLAGMDIDDLDGGKADTTGDRSVFKGPEPSARRATSIEQAASLIADWASELIEKEGLGSHEICVAPVRDAVKSALAAKGIGFLELEARRVDPGKAEPGVRLGSIRRIKGLEFKAVAMITDQSDDHPSRLERYVAATRARQRLLIIELSTAEASTAPGPALKSAADERA
jgi:mRNA-degrading endonuclease RelE of RelBE toxin-antitoxin system